MFLEYAFAVHQQGDRGGDYERAYAVDDGMLLDEHSAGHAEHAELREGRCTVDVMRSEDVWHGMTYREDKQEVVSAISGLIAAGEYPERLWS